MGVNACCTSVCLCNMCVARVQHVCCACAHDGVGATMLCACACYAHARCSRFMGVNMLSVFWDRARYVRGAPRYARRDTVGGRLRLPNARLTLYKQ